MLQCLYLGLKRSSGWGRKGLRCLCIGSIGPKNESSIVMDRQTLPIKRKKAMEPLQLPGERCTLEA
ncbi:MAG: hypothetical protein CMH56_13820 [Myxococcales bacterium]|nr:hypothetical protein [Myxococcales bacterium]